MDRVIQLFKITMLAFIFIQGLISSVNAQTQKGLSFNGESAGDLNGYAISMPDANTIAIGAPNNDGENQGAGYVRVFSWNGTN